MPLCPFSTERRDCYPECALYTEAVGKCVFYVQAMLLEDLQKVAVATYEKLVRDEETYLRRRLAELEQESETKTSEKTSD